jgi:DNA-binding response OmpR family regulator
MTRVAIIEDDQMIAQMYRMKFEADGFQVDLAEDGKSGVQMVLQNPPDLVLLDLTLPELDGKEILQMMRRNTVTKKTPVIVLTNLDAPELPAELAEFQIIDYIVKADETPREIVAKVKKVLHI